MDRGVGISGDVCSIVDVIIESQIPTLLQSDVDCWSIVGEGRRADLMNRSPKVT
jgi:hypothetical protein